jgi:GTP-binding protein EngB required for normal cell division
VLTKIDKLDPVKLTQLIKDMEEKMQTHPYCFPEVVVTSSAHSGLGLERLRALIASAADLIKPTGE